MDGPDYIVTPFHRVVIVALPSQYLVREGEGGGSQAPSPPPAPGLKSTNAIEGFLESVGRYVP